MSPEPRERFPDTHDFAAYDRQSVERFFVAACEARERLLEQTAVARRRIAAAEALLAEASGEEFRSVRAVLEGQRLLRDEVRANERAVAAIAEHAEAEAARVVASARARAATERTAVPAEDAGDAGDAETIARHHLAKRHLGRTPGGRSSWPSARSF